MKKHPEQTEQTKKNITDAFWQLAKDDGINAVSVSAVMKRAGYNRGTFYVYFTDIPDLVMQTEQDLLADFSDMTDEMREKGLPSDISGIIELMMRKIDALGDRIYILLGKGGDPNFVSMVRKEMIERFPIPHPDKEYIVTFVTSALVGMLTHWYESGKAEPIDKVISVTHGILSKGLYMRESIDK